MLPDELLLTLNDRYPCRAHQISILGTLLDPRFPTPSSLAIHGLEATGKSSVTKATLLSLKTPHAIVDSRRCVTGRQLLERALLACQEAISESTDTDLEFANLGRCENLNALQTQLERLLHGQRCFVLVFDGIDKQREAPDTLIPALARFGEMIPCLSIVFIVSVPSPRYFDKIGMPSVHFPPYTRDESIRILSLTPQKILKDVLDPDVDYAKEEATEDDVYVWSRFCTAVWDSLAKSAARDLESYRTICEKLWSPFTLPIVDGAIGTRDFARLMVSGRPLFQTEDILLYNITAEGPKKTIDALNRVSHELPFYSKWVLCAAYLASYNPARQDAIFFMKASEKKRRKKGGGTARGRGTKHRKIPRSMLAPSYVSLDRMLAVLNAIFPHKLPRNADILTQLATLSSLRLIVSSGPSGIDVLDHSCRWRVACTMEYVVGLGRSIDFEMRDYLAGGLD